MLFITLYPVPWILCITSLFGGSVFIHWDHQEIPDGIVSFEIYLYPMLTANFLKAITGLFRVRHYHVNVVFFIVIRFVVAVVFVYNF